MENTNYSDGIVYLGAIRCYQYNREVGAALSNENTPRPTSDQQVWDFVLEVGTGLARKN